MAQGDLTLFDEFSGYLLEGRMDLASAADTVQVSLHNVIPTSSDVTPTYGDYTGTEVTGGTEYVAKGLAISAGQSVSQVTGGQPTYRYDTTSNLAWNQDGSGPTDVRAAIIWNETDTDGPDSAIGFIDMTTDGSTPVSLAAGNISITWNASGVFTVG